MSSSPVGECRVQVATLAIALFGIGAARFDARTIGESQSAINDDGLITIQALQNDLAVLLETAKFNGAHSRHTFFDNVDKIAVLA